jgi:2-polyprenyl-3-methyl-5-hydroxy-6-metoxy-1,4-benzoquinol methylase
VAFEDVMKTIMRLMVGTDALAAIGASLGMDQPGQETDPRLRAAAIATAEAAGATGIDELDPQQKAMARSIVRMCLRDADDAASEPSRAPGWAYTDQVIVEAYGRGSMAMPGLIAGAIPDLGEVNSFLDVGTGVGWLAVAAAGVWAGAKIVGIDNFEPSLEVARAHVAESGLEDRITLRQQDANDLADVEAFDCAWIPSFFFDEDELPKVVARVVSALRPGGTVVLGRFDSAPDPLAQAASAYRLVRIGGHPLDGERATEILKDAGCSEVRPLERTWQMPILFTAGRR